MKIFFSFFLLGLYFGAGPCMVSCGPLLVSYNVGTAKDVLRSITTYLLFCLGRLAVYLGLGIAVFFFGHLMTNYMLGGISRYVFIAGGIFIALIGVFISLGKNLNHSACLWAQEVFLKKDAKTVIIMGLVIGALPCAPLISIVSYIGLVAKSWVDSLLFSLCFGLGTVVSPLFLVAVFTGLIPKLKKWRFISSSKLFGAGRLERMFNFICGIVVVILGVRLFLRGL